jgi:thiosulfate/3-mercaptopyruvate sulfurtransferase
MPSPLVDAGWIANHRGDRGIRLVEVDVSPTAYMAGHIPGAVLWNAYADLRDPDYQPVARGSLEQLIARSGIEASSTIVVYGYGAALGFWLLKSCGFKDVRMLDGPRDQWSHAGGDWATGAEWPQPSRVGLPAEESSVAATRDEVLRAIGDPNTILVGVRSELEYAGERFWPSGAAENAGKAGHIPGATSVPIDLLRTESGALQAEPELQRVFDDAGATRDKRVITYCTIGNRASHAWLALKYVLGYPDARVYYGSWVDWGKRSDTPIET